MQMFNLMIIEQNRFADEKLQNQQRSFFVTSPERVLYFVLLAANFTWKGTNLQNLIEHLKSS